MRDELMEQFDKDFEELYYDNEINSKKFFPEGLKDTKFSISYPGYKTKIKNSKLAYDYRLNLHKEDEVYLPSHVNIIVDIYNKALQGSSYVIANLLYDLAENGDDVDLSRYKEVDDMNIKPAGEDVLNEVEKTYNRLNKSFDGKNNSWNYSVSELSNLITWIALQEEINYPMSKGYDGLRMPFYRYIEAIYVTGDNKTDLQDVIYRALLHRKPSLWKGKPVHYRPIVDLKRIG